MPTVPPSPAAADRTRARILDAAEACLRRDGIRRTTVLGVAEEAGISRAYLYRFFADKPTLVSAALIRRDEAFWASADAAISTARSVADMVAEAVLLSRAAPLGSLALSLAESEPQAYAEVMGTFVHEVVPGLTGFWVAQLEAAKERGLVRADLDCAAGAEWVIRILVSLVGVPGLAVDADDRSSLVSHLEAFLSPAFEARP
ncbi:MAG TPA: TetR/AcrR family transcriptional regulator [Marmoricola sp.]|nr:TetR/AcrR family transcriptional regulator [Marmoricola sp.]